MCPESARHGNFEACRIATGAPIVRALKSLEASSLSIVLVEDSQGRLIGTLTDGDIRRALLSGATLQSAVDAYVRRAFTSVGLSANRGEVLDLMQSLRINAIPILDEHGRLLGLHTLPEMLGSVARPNWAVIMAGGRGERLRPLTDTIPKPMIRVAGRPILEWIVLMLSGFGIQRVFLSVNYLAEQIERHFGDGDRFGCRIEYLREQVALGTAGALSLLPERPTDPVLVMNGDLVTRFDVGALLRYHEAECATITVGVREYLHTVPFGVVQTVGDQIHRIQEKPVHGWLTNAGVYVVNPEVLARLPQNGPAMFPDLVHSAVDLGQKVMPFELSGDWQDVGRPSELAQARGE